MLFLLYSLARHPHNSTLFPYTTLFRSSHSVFGLEQGRLVLGGLHRRVGFRLDDLLFRLLEIAVRLTLGVLLLADRKSTRLNSSHVAISYAVFCLKKKKKMLDVCIEKRY